MGIKVLGAILLGVFTAGSAVSGVSSALGNNQTVADVAENFGSKTDDNDKKKDGSDKKEGSDKNLVFCESNDSNSSNLKCNLALGGIGVACLAGGVALGIKANGGEEEYEQYHNDSVNETTTSEETTDEELENENTSNSSSKSNIFKRIFMFLLYALFFVFCATAGCFGCFCCCFCGCCDCH